jgi:hypothetical protein
MTDVEPASKSKRSRAVSLLPFTLAGIDELDLFPTPAARKKALDEIGRDFTWWEFVFGVLVTAGAAIGANWLLKMLFRMLFPGVPGLPGEGLEFLRLVMVMGAVLIVLRLLHRWGVRPALRQRLIESGVPVCLGCGYLLRGLPPDSTVHCPECGRAIDERVKAIMNPRE